MTILSQIMILMPIQMFFVLHAAALAHKNSEATRALAIQDDNLEKELGEMQKAMLAMQPDGVQCGYYVMKIIQSFMTVVNPASFLKNHFKLDAPYSNEEINAVRDEFAEFVKPLIID
ncbi:uncharacterized protein LOC115696930 isoform X2 [Cannabis sativa]|uniref:uncharacterized protein LOC115696930 isoform X2 n=1 Tax=Cannabis sativa TaxID=3483 RepID=UPI0029CAAB20|nr:uncharacterized protein LOC115696930 isoform X2 [Cannabis sativa]